VNSVVLARITRLGARFASLDILTIEDIRATEKDKVKVEESFRVGDIVRGEVISLGGSEGYYVSTARNELGVVIAWSGEDAESSPIQGGRMMEAISWREVRDPVTGRRETRKVAKPF
jgi:exosome complex component CSL4